MSHRRIIIGDVHGHYETLVTLLEKLAPNNDDEIYFLGDLIDRGPQSAQVVDFVIRNSYSCLLGNHEQMLLKTLGFGELDHHQLQAWLYSGGYNTLVSYDHKIPPEHIQWIKTLPSYLDLGDIWLVHAGVAPNIPLEEQTPQQMCWIRDEFHSMAQPYFQDKLIITGHTITFTFPGIAPGKLVSGAGWLDIDTGAYHPRSGWLTALDITEQKVYQAQRKNQTVRILTLEEAVVSIAPSEVFAKRAKQVS
ncbi:MAG TPA: serine/threonine protein phosphatase [Cyanothece sp. UBA12306]|nr:serine/threonine protein phosphatase [Cyanothece sp. UBA12306]